MNESLTKMENVRPSKARAAQIEVELAKIRHNFHANGVTTALHIRTGLELELAQMRAAKYTDEGAIHARKTQVLQVRAALIKKRLVEAGLEKLLDECTAEAEASVPELGMK